MAAYNNGFPMNYQQMYYPQQFQQFPQPQMPQQQMQATPQAQQPTQYPIVQGGFVRVMNENEARMYPVAPGNSVTFINENSPYCYTKTVNMGQLDRPIFEKYRLVKEDDAPQPVEGPHKPLENQTVDLSRFALATDLEAFRAEMEGIRNDIETFRVDLYGLAGKKKTVKKEAAADE